jgi:hypothetical protein
MMHILRMNELLLNLSKLTDTKLKVFQIGLFFTLMITLKEVFSLSYNNFQIFSYGSLDFWTGINPYIDWSHLSVHGQPLDQFLYGPLFSILFTPFTLLPGKIGVISWNIFTYTLFYFSVFTLPEQFNLIKKKFVFFYTALILFATLLSMQFNPVVAAIFLFSFTLFEKKQGFWAVLLIFLSGFIKVYGIFQITMLLFYPRLWKNILYALLIGTVLFFLPLLHLPLNALAGYYYSWILVVIDHLDVTRYYSIFRPVSLFFTTIGQFTVYISLGVLSAILFFTLFRLKLFKESLQYRANYLGIIMSWAILFSIGAERHTYLIALVGYIIWYLFSHRSRVDKVLLWMNFILLVILPIDILFPVDISDFVLGNLNLGIIIFTFTWIVMVYKTFSSPTLHENQ